MGGSHKRKLRAEKVKVKLKGTKLPKGINVTKTEFKLRKIVIREQLKDNRYSDGRKVLDVKEILFKLKHNSAKFRIEALKNLKDAINNNHPGLLPHMSNIIQGIASASMDIERAVRRESFKTLSNLLRQISVEDVSPFFHIISSYLCCAMTHIQAVVQEDALEMLDVLLQYVPQLLSVHSEKIINNFLEIISRVRDGGEKSGRTLTVNFSQKQSTIKWRSKVLLRLQKILENLCASKRNNFKVTGKTINSKNIIVGYTTKTEQHFGVKRYFAHNQAYGTSSIFNYSLGNMGLAIDRSISDEIEQSRLYIEHLMPLLLESWIEVRPQKESSSDNIETMLSAEAALTLKIVLEIIENLWILVEIYEEHFNNYDISIWFKNHYADIFSINFFQHLYPYQQEIILRSSDHVGGKKSAKNPTVISPHCFQQNLTIAFLMCQFYSNTLDMRSDKFKVILNYITQLVSSISSKSSNECLGSLVRALRILLLANGLILLRFHQVETKFLLKICVKAFLTNKFGELGIASKMLVLLCEIVQNSKLYEAYGCEEFSEFLEYLPNLLLKPTIHESYLLAMGRLGKQQNRSFLNALRSVLCNVVDNLQTIKVVGAINAFEGKKNIVNLFYWVNNQTGINKDETKSLLNAIEQNVTDKRIADYCQYVLCTL